MSRLPPLLTLTLTTCAPLPPPPSPTTIAIEPAAPAASTTAVAEPARPASRAPPARFIACPLIGIAPCDEYLARYSACAERMPESAHDAARQAVRTMCDGWHRSAETPQGAETLQQVCSTALEMHRQYGLCKD